jgi:protein-disulfide isomerase
MAAAKKIAEEMLPPEPVHGEDVIVIRKWWVASVVAGLIGFALGGVMVYFITASSFERAASVQADALAQQQAAAAAQAAAQAPAAGAAQAQPPAPPARLDNVTDGGNPSLGPSDAKVTVIEFSDFQCPFCKRWRDDTLDALRKQYGDQIRIVYRDFPLTSLHPEAQKAAEAAGCANEQGKFWEFHDLLFANQATLGVDAYKQHAVTLGLNAEQFNACLDGDKYASEVAADVKDGNSYGVSGTPTFFINGVRLVGAQPLAAFQSVIDQELKK